MKSQIKEILWLWYRVFPRPHNISGQDNHVEPLRNSAVFHPVEELLCQEYHPTVSRNCSSISRYTVPVTQTLAKKKKNSQTKPNIYCLCVRSHSRQLVGYLLATIMSINLSISVKIALLLIRILLIKSAFWTWSIISSTLLLCVDNIFLQGVDKWLRTILWIDVIVISNMSDAVRIDNSELCSNTSRKIQFFPQIVLFVLDIQKFSLKVHMRTSYRFLFCRHWWCHHIEYYFFVAYTL